jgi:hypothetical protein
MNNKSPLYRVIPTARRPLNRAVQSALLIIGASALATPGFTQEEAKKGGYNGNAIHRTGSLSEKEENLSSTGSWIVCCVKSFGRVSTAGFFLHHALAHVGWSSGHTF